MSKKTAKQPQPRKFDATAERFISGLYNGKGSVYETQEVREMRAWGFTKNTSK